jgi:hypothetical protein
VESYDQVLNNFRASYFAGAVIMERNALLDDLRAFFGQPHWDPAPLRAMMTRIQATPEMLFYRLTELVPHAFGLDDFFFLRFHHTVGSEDVELTKILNMSQVAVPHGIGLQEHYCRRWPAIRLLRDMAQRQTGSAPPTNGTAGADIHAQRSVYLKDDVEFFVLSCARPLALQPRTNSCVSIGFLLNETFRDTVRFWADDSLPRVHVGLTCERCPLPPETCRERVAPPSADEARKAQDRKKTALAELTRSLRS